MPRKILTIEAINQRLADTGIRVYLRGKKLYLRATLPSKDGTGEKQQWVSLGLGTTPIELEQAEAKAWELHAQRVMERFDWTNWSDSPKTQRLTCSQWIEKYKAHRQGQGFSEENWKIHQWYYFKRLPPDQPLTEKVLIETVTHSVPNSRDRKYLCSALKRLAEFAEIECNLSKYQGDYSHRKVKARKLPSDQLIEQIRDTIFIQGRARQEAYNWQWVYGVMAAYGLRNHEIFYCKIDPEPPYACHVSEGKTGSRIVYPLYPEWAERWGLPDMKIPQLLRVGGTIEEKTHLWLGHKVSGALVRFFRRLPKGQRHQPYDLRHCYALRGSLKFRIQPRIMADLMGHDVDIHLKIYSRWLRQSDSEQAYLDAIAIRSQD